MVMVAVALFIAPSSTRNEKASMPVKDDDGRVTNWIGIDFDITERKNAELESKNKVLELTRLNKALLKKDKELKKVTKLLEELTKNAIQNN